MSRRGLVDSTEDKLIVAALVIVFIGSIGFATAEAALGWDIPASWNIPIIIFTLGAILKLLSPVPEIHSDTAYLKQALDLGSKELVTQAEQLRALMQQAVGSHSIVAFPTAAQYYLELNKALKTTQRTIDLTHIRGEDPQQYYGIDDGWFDNVMRWVEDGKGREVRRIMTVRDGMRDWATSLAEQTEGTQFKVKVVDWPRQFAALNMAIMDDERVYLALPGPSPQRSPGIATDDEHTVKHFGTFFNELYKDSETIDLAKWLKQTERIR